MCKITMDVTRVAAEYGCFSDSSIDSSLFQALYEKNKKIECQLANHSKSSKISIDGSADKTPSGQTRDLDLCRTLLELEWDVNRRDNRGWTALHHAAVAGHGNILRLLLQRGADPNIRTPRNKYNLLHIMVLKKQLHLVPCLKSSNIRINSQDYRGLTALHMIADEGLGEEALAQIASLGDIQVDKRNREQETPLMRAVKANNIAAICGLIKRGADINLQDSYGKSPLYIATEAQHELAIKTLFSHSPEPPISHNPLLHYPTALLLAVAKEYDNTILSALLSDDNEIDIPNDRGLTPLLMAVGLNDSEATRILIQAKANTFTGEARGYSAISTALSYKNWKILADLTGINIHILILRQTQDIFETAINLHNIDFIKTLIEIGEIVRDEHIDLALRSMDKDVLNAVTDNFEIDMSKKDYISVYRAVCYKNSKLLRKLLEKGANPDYWAPLWSAACNNSIEEMKILIEFEADVDITYYGCPPLWLAVETFSLEAAELLLTANCNPCCTNTYTKESALQRSVMGPEPKMTELLLRHGALPSTEIDELLDAVLLNKLSIVEMLVESGATILEHHTEIAGMCSHQIQRYLIEKQNLLSDLVTSSQVCLSENDGEYVILKRQDNASLKQFVEKLQKQGILIKLLDVTLEAHNEQLISFVEYTRKKYYDVKMIFYDYAKVVQHDKEIKEIFESCQKPFSAIQYELIVSKPQILFSHMKDNTDSSLRIASKKYHHEVVFWRVSGPPDCHNDSPETCQNTTIKLNNPHMLDDPQFMLSALGILSTYYTKQKVLHDVALSIYDSFANTQRINKIQDQPPIPLQSAAFEGYLEYLQHRINTGDYVNHVNDFGRTPLHWAVLGNQANIVTYLIDAGANVQKGDKTEWTSLNMSTYNGFDKISQALLDAGAEIQDIDLRSACMKRNIDTVKKMMKQHKFIQYNINNINDIEDAKEREEVWRCCINTFSENGNNVALQALLLKANDCLRQILKIDANLANSQNLYTGESILHVAVTFKHEEFKEILELLEEFGGNLDLLCKDRKETALYKAIRLNRMDNARLLIVTKADCSIGSELSGLSSLHLASERNFEDLVELMTDFGTKPPESWPRQINSLEKLARIKIRNCVPKKHFRNNIRMSLLHIELINTVDPPIIAE